MEADKLAIGERILIGPTDALLVIDVQPTFMPGGGLPVSGGNEVVPVIRNQLMLLFPIERRIATKDRHPKGHISLASSYVGTEPGLVLMSERPSENEPFDTAVHPSTGDDAKTFIYAVRQGRVARTKLALAPQAKFDVDDLVMYLQHCDQQVLWPDHAIAGTWEAEIHPDFAHRVGCAEEEFTYVLVKGTDPREDSYSGFKGNAGTPTELADVLRDRGITRIFVCGLALDYCVRYTAEDGRAASFEVVVIEDATRAVGFPEGSVEATRQSFAEKGIRLVRSDQLVAR